MSNFLGHPLKSKSVIKGYSVVMQKLMAACSDSKKVNRKNRRKKMQMQVRENERKKFSNTIVL